MPPVAVVSRKGADRVRDGHPWIYKSDVVDTTAEPGDLVRVLTERKRPIGWAFWSSASQIALRFVSSETASAPPDERALLRQRLQAARAYRESLSIDATAYRLLNGEADRWPATIVDVYGDTSRTYFVVQTLSQAADRRLDLLVEALVTDFAPAGILARNDPKVRRLEGLEEQVAVVYGDVPDRVDVREGAIALKVDLRHGQKTGMFLDQRENRRRVRAIAGGARVLNAFAFTGAFAVAAGLGGARAVVSVDTSRPALALAEQAWARNGLDPTAASWVEADVFDWLRAGPEVFDAIVLDPPPFARRRRDRDAALRGYRDLNLQAFRRLARGGWLLTCSCSQHLDRGSFREVVAHAAGAAGRPAQVVAELGHAGDHPTALAHPEGEYLKALLLRA
jgi:23S rRNA (cytosine1962-C5)-methyltransferase